MKKTLSITTALFLCFALMAQKDYKVVFDLTSGDSLSQATAIRWVSGIARVEPDAQVEVVMFGKGLPLITKDKSVMADSVIALASMKNVAFKVCAIAMKNQKVDKSQLLPGVQIIPDGIYEIITKQREGWGYVKVAH